jgi:hypothetical protein
MYSDEFKINVNKLNADEALLVILEIEHPLVDDPIRLVNDSQDLFFKGNTYIAMPFILKKQDDIQGELPRATITIANVGRTMIKWIDASGGGRGAKIKVSLVRRTSTDEEESISFDVGSVSVTTERVVFNLIIQNNLAKRAIRWVYDMVHSRGLF